jgi:hypothetical protein
MGLGNLKLAAWCQSAVAMGEEVGVVGMIEACLLWCVSVYCW